MSEGENAILVISGFISLIFWSWWCGVTLMAKRSKVPGRVAARGLLLGAPALALLLLWSVLQLWSSHDVRDDGRYLSMYTALGLAWCGLANMIPPWLGISFRHDALARANRAAGWVLFGWIVAVMLCFSGGNVGDGPGWWVVVFSAALSTGMLVTVVALWELVAKTNDAIVIDRDVATGLRTAGMLIGCGAVFGVSVAGDWQSTNATIRDFLTTAWPAIPIFIAALLFHFLLRPTGDNPRPSVMAAGVIPMLLLIGMGFAWAMLIGSRIVGGGA